jgi:hypothetical protein
MSSATRSHEHDGLRLSHLSDIEILHRITSLVSKEHSVETEALLLEMIRRFTAPKTTSPIQNTDRPSILGIAKWGDAKRVYEIFGIKRGPLDRLWKKEIITSRSLDDDADDGSPSSSVRAKRLYDLVSIETFLRSPAGKKFAEICDRSHESDGKVNPTGKRRISRRK